MKYPHTLSALAPVAAVITLALGLSACSNMKKDAPAAPVAASAPATPASAQAVAEAPASKAPSVADAALADGLKSYQAGQYRQAESQLKTALQAGLKVPADVANADKHLAFIYCMTKRDKMCAASFKAAKAADPDFALSKTEAGHPMWAKTYKKAMGLK
jgi:Tfp pilus assembly protein PilF